MSLQCVTLLCYMRHSPVVTRCNVTVLHETSNGCYKVYRYMIHSQVVTMCDISVIGDIHWLLQGVSLQETFTGCYKV